MPPTTATKSEPSGATGMPASLLPLSGRRIALDPGHGPRDDLGAVLLDPDSGTLILSEAEFNLDVALRCRDIMRSRGAEVVLTRENADTFTAPWPVDANGDGIVGGSKDDLQERIDIINASKAEVFLSIHANSAPSQKDIRRGLQVFYCAAPDCPLGEKSKRLGELVLGNLQDELAHADYRVQRAELHDDLWPDNKHLFMLGPVNLPSHVRSSQMPGVLSESLYVTTPDGPDLKRDDIRNAIALAYADALQAFLTGADK
jgi:N-acetylmuramoyl-L-alanine amidase